jgi:hypothetical protein
VINPILATGIARRTLTAGDFATINGVERETGPEPLMAAPSADQVIAPARPTQNGEPIQSDDDREIVGIMMPLFGNAPTAEGPSMSAATLVDPNRLLAIEAVPVALTNMSVLFAAPRPAGSPLFHAGPGGASRFARVFANRSRKRIRRGGHREELTLNGDPSASHRRTSDWFVADERRDAIDLRTAKCDAVSVDQYQTIESSLSDGSVAEMAVDIYLGNVSRGLTLEEVLDVEGNGSADTASSKLGWIIGGVGLVVVTCSSNDS